MTEKTLAVFEGQRIRRNYDEKTDTWYFSIVDIVQVLIQQPDFQTALKYWNKLKERLNDMNFDRGSAPSPSPELTGGCLATSLTL